MNKKIKKPTSADASQGRQKNIAKINKNLALFSLTELEPIFKSLAKRVSKHRRDNKGYVIEKIFPYCNTIGGNFFCVELAIEVVDSKGKVSGYYLKKRGKGELGWQGKYHITGVGVRTTDRPQDIFNRLYIEIFGKKIPTKYSLKNLKFIGIEVHDEPERDTTAWTAVWKMNIKKSQISLLTGQWRFFKLKDINNSQIVNHQHNTLKWISKASPDIFVNLR